MLAVHGLIVAAAAALGMAASAPPNIVMILVDDLGWGGIADNNPHVLGPRVSELKAESLSLTSHYVYKFCSPTRGSLLSGRYPMRLGSMKSNFIPWSRPDGLNPGFTLLPQRLAKRGFESHHVGKWHLGFYNATTLMPTARGFDSFFGYLAGEQDHFTQEVGSFIECKAVVDLTENLTAARGANGTYSGYLYNARAVAVAKTATEPFFLNYWLQNTHGPFEVPERYSALYRFKDPRQNTFNGMVSVVDEAVGNLTAALKARGVWSNTLVVYTHDNGAPLGGGGSNFPFRGGKNSNFEGGVRVPALLGGGFKGLPAALRGARSDALFHVSDWLPTLLSAVDGAPIAMPLVDSVSRTIPYDGVDQWAALIAPVAAAIDAGTDAKAGGARDTGGNARAVLPPAPRSEILLDHCLPQTADEFSGTGCNHYEVEGKLVGALIVRDADAPGTEWKLVVGPNDGDWTSQTNGTKVKRDGGRACDDGCLFNLTADPSEHVDLSASSAHARKYAALVAKFEAYTPSYHPPMANPPADDAGCCAAAKANGNFLSPWTPAAPSPGRHPRVGNCTGGPGGAGWEVRNSTGGGGPAFAAYRAGYDLSDASVAQCRALCCASPFCVSVVLHAAGCYLNPRDGTAAPYARPETLLAYVERANA